MHLKIRILDKYIFREVFSSFLFAICAFSAVFIGSGTLFRIAQYITDYGASLPSVIKIFVFSLPGVVMWTFPMAMLLASLLTFGRLSSASEITAMKSCGIGFGRIAAPAILLGFIVSVGAIFFNEHVVPRANTAYRNVIYYEIEGNSGMKSQEHVIIKEIEEGQIRRLVYARSYDAEQERLTGISLQVFGDDGKVTHVENAEYAEWTGTEWIMHNGDVYDIADEHLERRMRFETQVLPVQKDPRQIIREQKAPEAELYQRVSVPMASLIFTLIGVPLGLQPTRNSSSAGFAMSVIIIFFYYALMTMGNAFARGEVLPPMLAVWIPNIVGIIAGTILLRRASQ